MMESDQNDVRRADIVTNRLESLSRMAGGVTHDFNNMLAAIQANTEAVLSLTPSNAETRPYIDRIASNTRCAISHIHHIQKLIKNDLAESEAIEVGALVTQVVGELEPSVPGDCHIYTEGLDAHCCVTAIPDLLQESLTSLIKNAIEALLNGRGHVYIRLRCEEPWPGKAQGMVLGADALSRGTCTMLEVQDDGEGIPSDMLSRIFDPFFTTRLRAHGLGLIPVVGLIHSCQVALQVLSQEAQGTTMRLCFEE